MDCFNRYMNRIEAGDDLKEKTKSNLKNALAAKEAAGQKSERGSIIMKTLNIVNNNQDNSKPRWNRLLAAAGTFAAVAAVSVAGYIYYMMPVNFVSLDINPGVELTLNAMDRVIGIEATNEDGKSILEGEKIRNRSVEKAISALVQNAYEQGYVNQDGSTVIAVLAESDDKAKALQLQEKTSNGVALAMQAKNAYSAVYATTSDLAFRNEAKEMGVSPGKYRLVKMLQAMDPEIIPEQYMNAKVSEIVNRANEMLQAGNTFGNLDAATQEMARKAQQACEDSAASQVQAAEQYRRQEQNRSGDAATSQNQEQNQEQSRSGDAATSQNQEQNQEQNQNGDAVTSQNQDQNQNGESGTSQNQSGDAVTSQNQDQSQNQYGNTSQQASDPGQGSGICSSQSCSGTSQGTSSCSSQSCSGTSQGSSGGGSGKG
ncbi:MAG: anti-sigma-I factor RsgI family protein [Saccharofermentanales bacterium]